MLGLKTQKTRLTDNEMSVLGDRQFIQLPRTTKKSSYILELLKLSQAGHNGCLEKEETLFKRIDHIALDVADIDRSIEFYEKHFGCRKYYEHLTGRGLRIAYLRSGDTVLELVNRDAGGMNGFHFCFETDEFDVEVKRLKNAGIPVLTEPHATEAREKREVGWRRVVFSGPDGEAIEFRG